MLVTVCAVADMLSISSGRTASANVAAATSSGASSARCSGESFCGGSVCFEAEALTAIAAARLSSAGVKRGPLDWISAVVSVPATAGSLLEPVADAATLLVACPPADAANVRNISASGDPDASSGLNAIASATQRFPFPEPRDSSSASAAPAFPRVCDAPGVCEGVKKRSASANSSALGDDPSAEALS